MRHTSWPAWLRWCLTPLSIVPVAVAYLVYGAVDRVAPGMLSEAVGVVAAGIGSAGFVYCAKAIAPSFRRYVGYTLAASVLVGATYFIVMSAVKAPGAPAAPYAVLVGIVAAAAAVYASAMKVKGLPEALGGEIYGWMPGFVRWCAFIPLALVTSLLAAYALGLPLAFVRFDSGLVALANAPSAAAVFVAVAAAAAPHRKKAVAMTLGIAAALVILLLFWSGLTAAVNRQMLPLYVGQMPEIAVSLTIWSQILTAAGALAGLFIALRAVWATSST